MPKPTIKKPVIWPTQERSRNTFNAILEATTYFILNNGFSGFTSNQIAERAGVNINSFYQYFLNKDAAIMEVVNRFLQEDDKAFFDLTQKAKNFKDVLTGTDEIMKKDLKLRKSILLNLQQLIGSERVYDRRRKFAELLEPFMPKDRDRKLTAQIIVHTYLSVVVGFMDVHGRNTEVKDLQKELSSLLLNYVG